MSYSFSVRAATKAEALAKVVDELDKVVAAQPVHAADRQQAHAAAESFLGVIPQADETKDVQVYVSGSVSWSGTPGTEAVVTSAGVAVTAQLVSKQ